MPRQFSKICCQNCQNWGTLFSETNWVFPKVCDNSATHETNDARFEWNDIQQKAFNDPIEILINEPDEDEAATEDNNAIETKALQERPNTRLPWWQSSSPGQRTVS